jgi:hypothetical protein
MERVRTQGDEPVLGSLNARAWVEAKVPQGAWGGGAKMLMPESGVKHWTDRRNAD